MAKYYHEPSSLTRDLLARVEALEATSDGGQSSDGLATIDMLEDAAISLSSAIADLYAQAQTLTNRLTALEGDDPLPEQSGQSGKFLGTDGSTPSWSTPSGTGVSDHGLLTGLADDDHSQYHTDARGDVRYSQLGHGHTASDVSDFDAAVTSSTHAGRTDNPHAVDLSQVTGDSDDITEGSVNLFLTQDERDRITAAEDEAQDTTSPSGFVNRASSVISFSNATRRLSISPAALGWTFWVNGTRFTKTALEQIAIPDVEGLHHIYYNDAGSLASTMTFSEDIITRYAYVAAVYWNATAGEAVLFADERHGMDMSPTTHVYLHSTQGAQYESGMALGGFTIGNGTLDAHAQFGVEAGQFRDEDILHELAADSAPATIPVMYRTGAAGYWRVDTPDTFPTIQYPTGRLAYNEWDGSTWTQTEVPNNDYVLTHIFATNDVDYPYRGIQGQATYGNISQARAGATAEVASLITEGLPMVEFILVATVIFQTGNTLTNTPKARIVTTDTGDNYVNWLTADITSGSAPTSHLNLTDIGVYPHVDIDTHIDDVDNPHAVTAAQVGAAETSHTHAPTDIGAVDGPASSANANLPMFSGTTGHLLADSGIAVSTVGSAITHSLATDENPHGVTAELLAAREPYVQLRKSSSTSATIRQNLGGVGGTANNITWDVQQHYDSTYFTHSTSTSTERILVNAAGRYRIVACVTAANGGAGWLALSLFHTINGTDNRYQIGRGKSPSSTHPEITMNYVAEVDLAANDIIRIRSQVDTAEGTYTAYTDYLECEVIVTKIG
jgi:hypothetical protein